MSPHVENLSDLEQEDRFHTGQKLYASLPSIVNYWWAELGVVALAVAFEKDSGKEVDECILKRRVGLMKDSANDRIRVLV